MIPRASRISGGWAFLVLFGAWALLWGSGARFDFAYLASVRVSFAGPTLLFAFLFLRHLARRDEMPRRELVARLVGSALGCAVCAWRAVETARAYQAMDDAPRGLLWAFNIVLAPLFGLGATFAARLLIAPGSLLRRKAPANPKA